MAAVMLGGLACGKRFVCKRPRNSRTDLFRWRRGHRPGVRAGMGADCHGSARRRGMAATALRALILRECGCVPTPTAKTVVVLLDDADLSTAASTTGFPSEVYVYVGTKQKGGHPIEQSGLT